jgi:hypothetical protein
LRALCGLAALALGGGQLAWAQPAPAVDTRTPELLNSERIERTFGSYGIEVLESDARTRVANLYSIAGAARVCRTFAVTRYPTAIDPRLAAEHATIVSGGSIGATFAARGWTVLKTHRYFGEIDATPRLAALMGGIDAARLAVHVYALDVAKDGTRLEYATIAEIHHPEYLDLEDIRAIYGGGTTVPPRPDEATRALLELVVSKASGPSLP